MKVVVVMFQLHLLKSMQSFNEEMSGHLFLMIKQIMSIIFIFFLHEIFKKIWLSAIVHYLTFSSDWVLISIVLLTNLCRPLSILLMRFCRHIMLKTNRCCASCLLWRRKNKNSIVWNVYSCKKISSRHRFHRPKLLTLNWPEKQYQFVRITDNVK